VGPPEAERREKEKRQRMMLLGGIALAGVVAFLLMRRK
jgi:LPXTG-motif cell wall-anchored protein